MKFLRAFLKLVGNRKRDATLLVSNHSCPSQHV